ncbi:MAG: hypothetical protein WC449_00720 [Candidatus Paceibacterota bacterium]
MPNPETKWKIISGLLCLGALTLAILFGKEWVNNAFLEVENKELAKEITG